MTEIISIDVQSERQRIGQILDGKPEEYAWFVNTYSQHVFDFTSRMLPNAEDAREVAQDAFVKAFRSLASFGFHSSFCTWVCRIAYHESLNRLKHQQPHYVDIADIPALEDDEELSTGREERIILMEEVIDDLPPDERLLLTLHYFENRPLDDCAYIMDSTSHALANRLYRIRRKLYKKLQKI
jgi:RNA polymerase sigma-70 factor (ECF subfamily)